MLSRPVDGRFQVMSFGNTYTENTTCVLGYNKK
jgi:hypothetical protein